MSLSAKKLLGGIALFFVLLIAVTYVFRASIMTWLLTPQATLSADDMWEPLDYSATTHWKAHPQIAERDWIVEFDDGFSVATTVADVFYIHPTGYFSSASWNSDAAASGYADDMFELQMRAQASAFAECCDVYAPQYREAGVYAFFDEEMQNGPVALDRAYVDVEAAFLAFLAQRDASRPFYILSHSQGSAHGMRLLAEHVDGKPAADQLVAAFLIGYSISAAYVDELLSEIGLCESDLDQKCIITWDSSMPEGYVTIFAPQWYPDGWKRSSGEDFSCINPLNWSMTERAPASQNLGSLPVFTEFDVSKAAINESVGKPITVMPVEEGRYGSYCEAGLLRVTGIDENSPFAMGISEDRRLHLFDINLFWGNIRRNALERALMH